MTFTWKHPKYYKKNKNINSEGSEQADEPTSERASKRCQRKEKKLGFSIRRQ
jgi:hypothetical protein